MLKLSWYKGDKSKSLTYYTALRWAGRTMRCVGGGRTQATDHAAHPLRATATFVKRGAATHNADDIVIIIVLGALLLVDLARVT